MPQLAITVLVSVSLLAGLVWLFRRLAASMESNSFEPEWWEHFSVDRYLPLSSLLAEEDFIFLRGLPGYQPAAEREFRARRVKICKVYLNEMRADFGRLQAAGQAMLAAGRAGVEFQNELFRQKVRFTKAWWSVRLQLAGYEIGLNRVDTTGLVEMLDVSATQFRPLMNPAAN
jgi:hypothetical protein